MSGHIAASPETIYRALLDADSIARWRVPDGMTSHVHEFEPQECGSFRVSVTYVEPGSAGKTSAHTDTYAGHFDQLVPNRLVVEVLAFETDDPGMSGTMTMTTTLTPRESGTDVTISHDGLPDSVPTADNEAGTRMALANLAALVERP